jgi:hypothetical protein
VCGLSVSGSDEGRRHESRTCFARGSEQLAATEIEVDYLGVVRGHRDEFPVGRKSLSQLDDSSAKPVSD